MELYLICFILVISLITKTIKCKNNILDSFDIEDYTLYFDSYHFELNNADEWSIDYNNNDIVSCTIKIPSLCIHIVPYHPIITLFYNHTIFEFANDYNWSQITIINNINNNNNLNHNKRRLKATCDPFYDSDCKKKKTKKRKKGSKVSKRERERRYKAREKRRKKRRVKRDKRRQRRYAQFFALMKKMRPKVGTYLGPPHIVGM